MDRLRRVAFVMPMLAALALAAIAGKDAAESDQALGVAAGSAADAGLNTLISASMRDPRDPALHEAIAMLQMRRPAEQGAVGSSLRHALDALALRPTWPYAWALFVESSYLAGTTNVAYESALVHAAELGRNEPGVQRTIALYGLATWNETAPHARTAVERIVAASMGRDPEETLRIAQRRGRLGIACAHAVTGQRLGPESRYCKGREPK